MGIVDYRNFQAPVEPAKIKGSGCISTGALCLGIGGLWLGVVALFPAANQEHEEGVAYRAANVEQNYKSDDPVGYSEGFINNVITPLDKFDPPPVSEWQISLRPVG